MSTRRTIVLKEFLVHDPLLDVDTDTDNDCDDARNAPVPEPLDWRRWLVVSDCDDRGER